MIRRILSAILPLLFRGSPTAISRLVITGRVWPAVNCHSFRAFAHIGKEVCKGLSPAVAHRDTLATPIFKVLMVRIMAAGKHRLPSNKLRRAYMLARVAVKCVRIAFPTSAAFSVSGEQTAAGYMNEISAIAAAGPTSRGVVIVIKNDKSRKAITSYICPKLWRLFTFWMNTLQIFCFQTTATFCVTSRKKHGWLYRLVSTVTSAKPAGAAMTINSSKFNDCQARKSLTNEIFSHRGMINCVHILATILILLGSNSQGYSASGCVFPSSLDSFTDKIAGDSLTVADVNKIMCGVEKVEAELGLLPKGTFATVRARLDDIDTRFAVLLGKSGGQTLIGGTAASNELRLESTSHATKGVVRMGDPLAFDAVSPAQITANQNDYSACTEGICRINSDAARDITGLTGGIAGKTLYVFNSGSFNITLKHENSGSSAANRITTGHGTDITLRPNSGAGFLYDSTASRWRGSLLGGPTGFMVWKTADETVNNSTTLQNDDHLVFAACASCIYQIELWLLLDAANTTADWKFAWTVPAGATMFWGAADAQDGSGVPRFSTANDTTGSPATTATEATTITMGSDNPINGLIFKGIVRNSTTAGNFQLQWAQNTANATNSIILKDSFMKVTRIQ